MVIKKLHVFTLIGFINFSLSEAGSSFSSMGGSSHEHGIAPKLPALKLGRGLSTIFNRCELKKIPGSTPTFDNTPKYYLQTKHPFRLNRKIEGGDMLNAVDLANACLKAVKKSKH